MNAPRRLTMNKMGNNLAKLALGLTVLGAAAVVFACEQLNFGEPYEHAFNVGDEFTNDPNAEPGILTVLNTEAGKIYDWTIYKQPAQIPIPNYTAWALATNERVRYVMGQTQALGDEFSEEVRGSSGSAFIASGTFLVTVQERDSIGSGDDEDIETYYWEAVRFTKGSAVVDMDEAKTRNEDLMGGAVSFKKALELISGGQNGDFTLTPEAETLDSSFPTPRLTITDKGNIRINGNGKIVTVTKIGTPVLAIEAGVNLTLENITLKLSSSSTMASLFSITGNNATLTLAAGAALRPGPITVSSGGKLVMEAGSLVSPGGAPNVPGVRITGGAFDMHGGEISGSASQGVQVLTGTFSLHGGVIKGNTGAGVNGPLVMHNGEISGNAGGGVNGTLYMYGGKISGNTANAGGGVNGTLYMYGGEISGNTATNGGGVFVFSPGTFIMADGTIKDNIADNGAGVYDAAGSVNFTSPNAVITGNQVRDRTISDKYGGVYFNTTNYTRPANLDAIVSGNVGSTGTINGGNHNWPGP
jgi:hypothetical protein